jgi:hypothetical protein
MANVIEQAKSGRAACRTCKQAIAKGELRFGEETPNQFGEGPSLRWHHLPCAAERLPVELAAALTAYPGQVPERAALEAAMADAQASGRGKPGTLPHADRAPTGRARCMQCRQPIEKDSLRIAVERELETGAMMTRGAGYLHPGCVAAHLAQSGGGDRETLVAALRANSRLPPAELEAAIAEVS